MARYIDLDEYLKDTFCDKFDDCTSEEECLECWAKRNIEDVAPIIHAEWEHKDGIYGVAYCSNCDFELKYSNTNYCPNCGAKMDIE